MVAFARAGLLAVAAAAMAVAPASAGARKPPPPSYEVAVDQNVYIPTSDGTKLAADIYRPKAVGQALSLPDRRG